MLLVKTPVKTVEMINIKRSRPWDAGQKIPGSLYKHGLSY